MSRSGLTAHGPSLVEDPHFHGGRNKMMRSLLALVLSVFILSGCNTVHGVGKDVESVGETVSDAAK
jgi:predicted small secreted protein